MKNTILISYDLITPGKDYEKLWEHLKSYPDYIRPLESVWILKTSFTAKAVCDKIKFYIDDNDRVLVINITGDAAAWYGLSDYHSQWIKENL